MDNIFEKMSGVTVIFRGEKGIEKLSNVAAAVTINEAVVIYFEHSMLLIPWKQVITVEQKLDDKAKEELKQAFLKASEKNHEPMVG